MAKLVFQPYSKKRQFLLKLEMNVRKNFLQFSIDQMFATLPLRREIGFQTWQYLKKKVDKTGTGKFCSPFAQNGSNFA